MFVFSFQCPFEITLFSVIATDGRGYLNIALLRIIINVFIVVIMCYIV